MIILCAKYIIKNLLSISLKNIFDCFRIKLCPVEFTREVLQTLLYFHSPKFNNFVINKIAKMKMCPISKDDFFASSSLTGRLFKT